MSEHYHFIGIGGIGMSGIAKLLLGRGARVSGSDLKDSQATRELASLGAEIFIGHDAKNIRDTGLIVYSSAIKEDNPEIKEARRRSLSIIKRAEALAELMKEKTVVTVAGSHGKTTTASLISYLLIEAGLNPTVAIGGILRNIDTNAYFGGGDFFVAEADESDGSFLHYRPRYSIVTNIDREHLDYYKDFESEVNAFRDFLGRTEDGGCVFACSDDPNIRQILKSRKARQVLFGLGAGADIYPKNIQIKGLTSQFDCYCKEKSLGNFFLSLGGMHNVSNALSVIALGLELGIETRVIKNALSGYQGSRRRIEIKFQDQRYLIIDDYAHHPTEIKATLAAVKNLNPRRLIAVFQPHRFTRTKLLADEFGRSFDLADYIIITDIYSAGESPQEGVTAKTIFDRIKEHSPDKEVRLLPKEQIAGHVLKTMHPGDLVITLGAGDITKISQELVKMVAGGR